MIFTWQSTPSTKLPFFHWATRTGEENADEKKVKHKKSSMEKGKGVREKEKRKEANVEKDRKGKETKNGGT